MATYHVMHQRPIRLDSSPVGSGGVFSAGSYSRNARTPVLNNGRLNPRAVKQISSGSIIGMYSLKWGQILGIGLMSE